MQVRIQVISNNKKHTDVPCPGVAVFIGFATQGKSARLESAGESTLHMFSFGFSLGDVTGM